MGASTFVVFDVQFSYESLAVSLMAALLLVEARSAEAGRPRHVLLLMPLLFGALAVTHHMTGFFAAALFCGLAVLELLRRGSSGRARVWALAFPLSIIFRLTRSGWEIGNRIGPFSFLGVGIVFKGGDRDVVYRQVWIDIPPEANSAFERK